MRFSIVSREFQTNGETGNMICVETGNMICVMFRGTPSGRGEQRRSILGGIQGKFSKGRDFTSYYRAFLRPGEKLRIM